MVFPYTWISESNISLFFYLSLMGVSAFEIAINDKGQGEWSVVVPLVFKGTTQWEGRIFLMCLLCSAIFFLLVHIYFFLCVFTFLYHRM